MSSGHNEVLEHRVSTLEKIIEQTNLALKGIDESLRMLTALEAHHAQTKADTSRALDWLKDHDKRLRAIEQELPQLKMVNKYTITGVVALIGMMGAAAAKSVFGW